MVLSTAEKRPFSTEKSGHEALFRIFPFKSDHSFCSRCLFLSVKPMKERLKERLKHLHLRWPCAASGP